MDRFRESLRGFWLDGVVVETAYRQRGVVPTRAEYLAQRVHSIGVLQVLDLAELFRGTPLPPEIRHDESHEALRDAAARIIACANDLYSYDKERRAGDPNNLVTVLVQHEGMTLEQALDEVVRVHDEEVVVLESLAAGALRRFPQHHVAVAGWIEDVRAWIVGALEWTERAARYASGRAARRDPAALEPTGGPSEPLTSGRPTPSERGADQTTAPYSESSALTVPLFTPPSIHGSSSRGGPSTTGVPS